MHHTTSGRAAGVIRDVESYPAFADEVHHGNKKTPRTQVMWESGGVASVYLIKLCKSFQITKDLYGADLTGGEGLSIDSASIRTAERVGNPRRDGHDAPLRYHGSLRLEGHNGP
ncbi:hypothetical protein GCM10009745_24610 [Kribbella yunnanensis]|uniref:Uncharacterized protein n=1 Tax=Kribbella yunnanensis TaxID=190194 RepID=A0ABP4SZH5_9ACTN